MLVDKHEAKDLFQNEFTNTLLLQKINCEFLLDLLKDNDWSMIIKSHALIESLITELIISKTEEEKIKPLIERLPLSDEQIGKLKIIKDYELLSKEQISFIKRFSSLRNNLVHNFENIDFDLKHYVSSMDKNQKSAWGKAITWFTTDEDHQYWITGSINSPKITLWMSILMLASSVFLDSEELKIGSKIQTLAKETTDKIIQNAV